MVKVFSSLAIRARSAYCQTSENEIELERRSRDFEIDKFLGTLASNNCVVDNA